ncbi:camp-regulated phosphoprotein family protein Igo1 [Fusarium avenaceum]|nr:camp-regulated phosphoprotein family protein Igo1 [Fusarium avenaceum]
MDKPNTSEPGTEKNKALLSRYGIVPSRGNLLHHQLEGRKYFDSGDFALTQAHRSSDMGRVTTGSEHPIRQDISEPSCSVPSSSNLEGNALRRSSSEKKTGEPTVAQHAHLQEMEPRQKSQDHDVKEGHSA